MTLRPAWHRGGAEMPEKLARLAAAASLVTFGCAWLFSGDWRYGVAGVLVIAGLALAADKEG